MIKRQPRGIPVGGRFAGTTHSEGVSLPSARNESGAVPASGMPVLGTAAAGYTDWVDEDGHLTKQVRFDGVRPDDAPDGTAAVIIYGKRSTTEKHYRDGIQHDGSGDTPSQLYTSVDGRVETSRGYRKTRTSRFIDQDSPDGQPAKVIVHAETHPDWRQPPEGSVETTWMANGHRQDPGPGVPALTVAMPDGGTRSLHFPFGSQSDLDDGTPAEQHRNKDGQLIYQARFYDGFGFDGDDGEPAVRIWREDGSIAKELRYWGNRPSPGPNGEPAVTEYNPDGSVASTQQTVRWGASEASTFPLSGHTTAPAASRATRPGLMLICARRRSNAAPRSSCSTAPSRCL